MNPQDASIVLRRKEKDKETKGVLKLQHNNGNVSLSFFSEIEGDNSRGGRQVKRYKQIPDIVRQLCDFTIIEIDSQDPFVVSLQGHQDMLSFHFDNDANRSNFFDYIGQKVYLRHSKCHPHIFLLESPETNQELGMPFMTTLLPAPKKEISHHNRISFPSLKAALKQFVFEDPSSIDTISRDNFREFFMEDGRINPQSQFPVALYNKNIDISICAELFPLLLDPTLHDMTFEMRKEKENEEFTRYLSIKTQWTTLTKRQWENHTELRKLVVLLENDLKSKTYLFDKYNDPLCLQKFAFNVLLTLSYYDWDHASYVNNMIIFLVPYLQAYIQTIHDNYVVTPSGDSIPFEKAESLVFWSFKKFHEKNKIFDLIRPTKTPISKQVFMEVGNILVSKYPELLELLRQKHVFSLDFLRPDFNIWFMNVISQNEFIRYIVSIHCYPDSVQFFEGFVISLFLYHSPKLIEANPLNIEDFEKRYDLMKKNPSLSRLLCNTKIIYDELFSPKEIPPKEI